MVNNGGESPPLFFIIMKWFVIPSKFREKYQEALENNTIPASNQHSPELLGGWGNGYVLLEKWHPYYGINYYKIPVDVHGGLTFGMIVSKQLLKTYAELTEDDIGKYMIGFDTAHHNSMPMFGTKKAVEEETIRLLKQCYGVDIE